MPTLNEIIPSLLQRLPLGLIFIGIVDYIIGNQLVDLYLGMMDKSDPNQDYVFYAFIFLVIVNFIIMISTFLTSNSARRIDASGNAVNENETTTSTSTTST
jgi:hypothetical protein